MADYIGIIKKDSMIQTKKSENIVKFNKESFATQEKTDQ